MKRVKRDRCGYTGYACTGIPTLNKLYTGHKFVSDSNGTTRVSDLVPSFPADTPEAYKWVWLDNYLNLPLQVAALTTDESRFTGINMVGIKVQPHCASTDCIPAGWNGLPYGKALSVLGALNAYIKETDSASVDLADHTLCYTENDGTSLDPEEQLPGDERTLGPGYLDVVEFAETVDDAKDDTSTPEPPRNTELPSPITQSAMPIVQLQKWETAVNERLNTIVERVNAITLDMKDLFGMLDAMAASQTAASSIYPYFAITLASGSPFVPYGSLSNHPTYNVANGTILVNGRSVHVTGLTGLIPPFYVWLNISLGNLNNSTGQYGLVNVALNTTRSGDYTIGIGGVQPADSPSGTGNNRWRLYLIRQERSGISLDIVRTGKEGVLFRYVDSSLSPYRVYNTARCGAN